MNKSTHIDHLCPNHYNNCIVKNNAARKVY